MLSVRQWKEHSLQSQKTRGLQPNCPSTGEGIKEMWCIHTTEYYSAIKSETMLFTATRLELDMIRRELSQTDKDKEYVTSLMWNLKNSSTRELTK